MALLEEPEKLRGALAPLRRQLLSRLRAPASATELAHELGISRQKVNYHLRKLEDAGFVELVEQRQRRGCVERVVQARADAYIIDPSLMSGAGASRSGDPAGQLSPKITKAGDRHAADHLVESASATVRDVTRMQVAAEEAGRRLLTFTLETKVRLAEPADLHRFTEALASAVAGVVAEFDAPGGRPYRLLGVGHPSPRAGEQSEGEQ